MSTQQARTNRALNILAKWRVALTGWQLGTRPDTDPVAAAVRDHREATLLLRAELNALTDLLIRQHVISEGGYLAALERSATQLSDDLAARFPGITATETGLDLKFPEAADTMRNWPQ